jgi:hypothetical protein
MEASDFLNELHITNTVEIKPPESNKSNQTY